MPNTVYSNSFLANEAEDQFNSHLNLERFCQVNNTLTGIAGMKYVIHRYRATNGTQKVTQGNGNTQSITVGFDPIEYDILCAQNRFEWFDEEAMKDPYAIPVGVRHMATDMFNTVQGDIYGEFKKAELVTVPSAFNFDAFVDAASMFNIEGLEDTSIFAFVAPVDVAAIRKALLTTLQYTMPVGLAGYVGTVAGINIFTKKDATPGTITVATKQAVTIFNKKGMEIERPGRDSSDANIRKNTMFSRKYYVVALTDARYAVVMKKGGTMTLSSDTSVNSSKTYYEASGLGYVQAHPATGDDPSAKGWYELS